MTLKRGKGGDDKGGYSQQINLMSGVDVNEGKLSATTGCLGLYGTNELALGYGDTSKDLTFKSTGLVLNKDMTVSYGNNIVFVDNDTGSVPESVKLRMESNDLAFYGTSDGVYDTKIVKFTHDGHSEFSKSIFVRDDLIFRNHAVADGIKWHNDTILTAHIHRYSDEKLYFTNAHSANLTGITLAYSATSWTSTSDRRLKKNIEPLNLGLDAINKLKPVQYEWKNTESNDKIDYGFIAQEVIDVLPHAVVRGDDGNDGTGDVAKSSTEDAENVPSAWGVNYTEIIAPLVKAVQELSAKCDDLQRQIDIKQ